MQSRDEAGMSLIRKKDNESRYEPSKVVDEDRDLIRARGCISILFLAIHETIWQL